MTTKAVITGDIIASTQTQLNYQEVLERIAHDIRTRDANFKMDIYRGDGLQMLINDPIEGFITLLIVKAGLRRYNRDQEKSGFKTLLDARLSLGIGAIDNDVINRLGSMTGEAFSYSGRTLDHMKSEGAYTKITTASAELNEAFDAVTPLIDAITQRWTSQQAEAIYLSLLHDATQTEIGKALKISQRGAGKRLEGSNIDNILKYNSYFKKQIECKLTT